MSICPCACLQYQSVFGNTDTAIVRIGPLGLNQGSAIGAVSVWHPLLLVYLSHRNEGSTMLVGSLTSCTRDSQLLRLASTSSRDRLVLTSAWQLTSSCP
jgi:hypothetical protein